MAKNVFISFRFSDGNRYKEYLSVNNVDNLFRRNMMNVKPRYKKNPNSRIFDRDYDSYCSLIEWDEFTKNIGKYIDIASQKREHNYKYDIKKRL